MRTSVVDASVVAKWFFEEDQSNAARGLLASGRILFAPDLVWAEFGNLVWKRASRNEITAAEAAELVADFLRAPLRIIESATLLPASVELAIETGRSVYDCLYLALALGQNCRLVTADQRFVRSLANTAFAKHICLVDQIE